MTAKRFGAKDLTANTDTILMTGSPNTNSSVNVRFVNRNPNPVNVRLALVDANATNALAELSLEDYLEYDTEILAQDVLEDTGLVVPAGYTLVARANTSGVTVIAYGFEEQV